MWVYNVRKLHRPHSSDAFLADTVDIRLWAIVELYICIAQSLHKLCFFNSFNFAYWRIIMFHDVCIGSGQTFFRSGRVL